MILIQRLIHSGDLTLAKGIVERIVDRRSADAEAGCGSTVDDQGGFEATVLLIAVDVSQYRQRAHFAKYPRCPFIELADVIALQGELVLCTAQASSHPQILEGLHEESGSGYAGELAAQPCHDLVSGDLALCERFERYEHAPCINRTT